VTLVQTHVYSNIDSMIELTKAADAEYFGKCEFTRRAANVVFAYAVVKGTI